MTLKPSRLFCAVAVAAFAASGCQGMTTTINTGDEIALAPTAVVSVPATALVGETVTLNGEGSAAAEETTLTAHTWSVLNEPEGSSVTITGGASASFVPTHRGTYVIMLVVTQSDEQTAYQIVTVDVGGNRAPVATVGAPQSVAIGNAVTLAGGLSHDPDGDEFTYAWTVAEAPDGSAAEVEHATTATASIVPDVLGEYQLLLTVTDTDGLTGTATLTVTALEEVLNSPPVADPGLDRRVTVGDSVTLTGAASYDVDGDAMSFLWTMVSQPDGSNVSLDDPQSMTPTFDAVANGRYVLELVVSDDDASSDPVELTVTAIPENVTVPPVANAGNNVAVRVGTVANVDGSRSYDPHAGPFWYQWTLTRRPDGSQAAIINPQRARPFIVPDAPGRYDLTLRVESNSGFDVDTVTVTASVGMVRIAQDVVDAEYSPFLRALVYASANPRALHVLEPSTGEASALSLPNTPVAVSLSEDGARAAVAHASGFALVNLHPLSVEHVYLVSETAADVVFGRDDWVYVLTEDGVISVDLHDTGAGTVGTFLRSFYDTVRGRLHPTMQRIYGASVGVSPSDLSRVTLDSSGVAIDSRDSPYHGDFPVCNDIWPMANGKVAVTACGHVFATDEDLEQDLRHVGQLEGMARVASAVEHVQAGIIVSAAALDFRDEGEADVVRIHDSTTYAALDSVLLPRFVSGSAGYKPLVRHLFLDANGRDAIVVVEAENLAAQNPFGVFVLSLCGLGGPCEAAAPVACLSDLDCAYEAPGSCDGTGLIRTYPDDGVCLFGSCRHQPELEHCDYGCNSDTLACEACVPACEGLCGVDDGCGGSCPVGACEATSICDANNEVFAGRASGEVELGPVGAMWPLCGGNVMVSDPGGNHLSVLDLDGLRTHSRYVMSSAPSSFVVDADANVAFASLSPATLLARIELDTGAVEEWALDRPADELVLGPSDRLFVRSDGDPDTILMISRATGASLGTLTGDLGTELVFEPIAQKFFFREWSGAVSRHAYVPGDTPSLTFEESYDNGNSCGRLQVDPTGTKLAGVCDDSGSGVFLDIDAGDLTSVLGTWNFGGFSNAATFSSAGDRFAVVDRINGLEAFDTTSHLSVFESSFPTNGCSSTPTVRDFDFSLDGERLYILAECNWDNDTGVLLWETIE